MAKFRTREPAPAATPEAPAPAEPTAASLPKPAARQPVRGGFLRVVLAGTRTALELGKREGGKTRFIPLKLEGFDVEEMDIKEFEAKYRELPGYPVERCARLYVEYGARHGITDAALAELAELTTVAPQEAEQAKAAREAPFTPDKFLTRGPQNPKPPKTQVVIGKLIKD